KESSRRVRTIQSLRASNCPTNPSRYKTEPPPHTHLDELFWSFWMGYEGSTAYPSRPASPANPPKTGDYSCARGPFRLKQRKWQQNLPPTPRPSGRRGHAFPPPAFFVVPKNSNTPGPQPPREPTRSRPNGRVRRAFAAAAARTRPARAGRATSAPGSP